MSIFPTFHWGLLSFLQDEQLLIETWTFKVLCYRLWVLVRPPVLAGICSITLLEEGSSPLLLPSRVGTPGPSSPLLTLKGGGAPSYCWMGVKDWLTMRSLWHLCLGGEPYHSSHMASEVRGRAASLQWMLVKSWLSARPPMTPSMAPCYYW